MELENEYSILSPETQKVVAESRRAAELARNTAELARNTGELARNTAEETRELVSQIYSNMVYWYIDRTPDYSILSGINSTPIFKGHCIDVICKDIEISEEENKCCVCFESREKEEICRLNCAHSFCGSCVNRILETQLSVCCPLCRVAVVNITAQNKKIQEELKQNCCSKN
jgi:hypothetical protein